MLACPHSDRPAGGRVCLHVLEHNATSRVRRFTGIGKCYDILCNSCRQQPETDTLSTVCEECFAALDRDTAASDFVGQPEVRARASDLCFHHKSIHVPALSGLRLLALAPIESPAGLWLALTGTGTLIEIHPVDRSIRVVASVPLSELESDETAQKAENPRPPREPQWLLRVAPNGKFAAVVPTYGQRGLVLDLATGQVTLKLDRGDYHVDITGFSVAFVEVEGRTIVVHATAWNRLDASDAGTGELLTAREALPRGVEGNHHDLDYFHGLLTVSPGQDFIVDAGWVWQPAGVFAVWSLTRWLRENVWESEDGPSKAHFGWQASWDEPVCWLDSHRLLMAWSVEEFLFPAVMILDVAASRFEGWIAGPAGELVFDHYLFAFDLKQGMTVWDVATGERLLMEPEFCPIGYHRTTRQFFSFAGSTVMLSALVQQI